MNSGCGHTSPIGNIIEYSRVFTGEGVIPIRVNQKKKKKSSIHSLKRISVDFYNESGRRPKEYINSFEPPLNLLTLLKERRKRGRQKFDKKSIFS